MHAHSIRSSPKQVPLWYTKGFGGTITYSPYIYTSRSYDQGFYSALNVVSFLQKNTETDILSISGPFVPAHTNDPHVSYATRVTHMQFPTYSHIHYHPL